MIIDDGFLVGERRHDCEVGVGVSVFSLRSRLLDSRGVKDKDKDEIGCVEVISVSIACLQ